MRAIAQAIAEFTLGVTLGVAIIYCAAVGAAEPIHGGFAPLLLGAGPEQG